MKILIIDNGSKHVHEIVSSCIAYLGVRPEVLIWSEVTYEKTQQYNKIIISGSSIYSVRTYPEVYASQREIIERSSCPILGICAGFELICSFFGSPLIRDDVRNQGIYHITMTNSDILTAGYKSMIAYEAHHLVCLSVLPPLIELGRSDSGIEIIRHKTKPIYGVQFHPEVAIPRNNATIILARFLTLV